MIKIKKLPCTSNYRMQPQILDITSFNVPLAPKTTIMSFESKERLVHKPELDQNHALAKSDQNPDLRIKGKKPK